MVFFFFSLLWVSSLRWIKGLRRSSSHPTQQTSKKRKKKKGGKGGSSSAFSMWMFLIFHVSEHIWTLFTISGNPVLSQIDSNEIFRTIWQCALVVYFGGRLATLSLVARLISLRLQLNCLGGTPARVGGGGVRCLSTVQRRTLINILEAKAEAWDTQGDRERKREGGQNRTPQRSCQVWCLTVRTPATSTPPLRILGSPMSGSLKITRAINKQTEAITGRQRRGEGLD